jgi:hypothetical protein
MSGPPIGVATIRSSRATHAEPGAPPGSPQEVLRLPSAVQPERLTWRAELAAGYAVAALRQPEAGVCRVDRTGVALGHRAAGSITRARPTPLTLPP